VGALASSTLVATDFISLLYFLLIICDWYKISLIQIIFNLYGPFLNLFEAYNVSGSILNGFVSAIIVMILFIKSTLNQQWIINICYMCR
jgi:hypothetical protein